MIDEIDVLDEIEDADEFPLAGDEKQALERCEAMIARGIQTFIQVGDALAEIRAGKLYRMQFATFEDYCRDKWGIGGSRARQLIGAANVAREIESVTTVTLSNEAQAREIAKSAPADRPAVITRATEIAGDRTPTAQHITQAAAEIAAPDLPIDFSIVQRRLAAHGVALTSRMQGNHLAFTTCKEGMIGITSFDWSNVTDRLERMEAEPPDREALIAARRAEEIARSQANRIARGDPAYADDPSDRATHLAQEAADQSLLSTARANIGIGNIGDARRLLAQVQVSTWERDQLLATIPAGRRIVLAFADDDCVALLREAKAFEQSGLTTKLPAIGQALVLLVQGIRGAT